MTTGPRGLYRREHGAKSGVCGKKDRASEGLCFHRFSSRCIVLIFLELCFLFRLFIAFGFVFAFIGRYQAVLHFYGAFAALIAKIPLSSYRH